MKILSLLLISLILAACSKKEKLPIEDQDGFPSTSNTLPAPLVGKWTRTTSLRTFDYKPDEWVAEQGVASGHKYLQLNADKTYSSNRIDCNDCKIEYLGDTLYVKHSDGFYKFPIIVLNDTLLHIKTKIDQVAYSLPNTGFFDFILEEKYKRQ